MPRRPVRSRIPATRLAAGEKHPQHPKIEHDALSYAIHFLFEDTDLAENPHAEIGDILLDANETNRVAAVVAALKAIFDKHGTKLSDAEYLALPEWQQVLKTAASALAAIPQ